MRELNKELELLLRNVNEDTYILEKTANEKSIYPFSPEGRILAYLLSINAITYDKYLQMHREYTQRNQYLELFEMSPRTFGETWGEKHILSLYPQFIKATKENLADLYPDFDGEFDLWLDGIRVEVKACRANNTNLKGSLLGRAYLHSEAIASNFKYHYQQLKPSCCDIFIWIGVCRDALVYWVLTSEELINTGKFGTQHRNENTGKEKTSVFEGQVFMTEEELQPFLVKEEDILKAVYTKMN